MRTEHIMYLAEVGCLHRLSLASKQLKVTPQAIGKAIQTLEKELHTPLLKWTASGAFLTVEGEKLTMLCSTFLCQAETIAKRYSPQARQSQTVFTILTNLGGAIHQKLLPKLILQIYQQQPELRLHVLPTVMNDITAKILDESANLALIYYLSSIDAKSSDELLLEPLFPCQIVCQTTQNNPFALKPQLSMQDILDYPLIVQTPGDFSVLNLLPTLPHQAAYSVYSEAAYQEMVRSGAGIGLTITLPKICCKPLGQIIDIPLLNGPQVFFGCLYKRKWQKSPQFQLVRQCLHLLATTEQFPDEGGG